jgi:class 3 adenylate cyclase/tetratricopeptide (TPR) repeat protein
MTDIGRWLEERGLGEYTDVFIENGVDLDVVSQLSEEDLKDLGLNLGDRRRFQAALHNPPSADSAELEELTTALPSTPVREAERRQLTVMFADLVGSTELSQKLDPEELRQINRAYQDAATAAIEMYGGYIARYMGDGVLAYFGYPQAHEDDAERAVRAGLDLTESVTAIDTSPNLAVRVGISTGLVVVGDLIGKGASQESAVVGETPNVAARLQALADPNEVLVAPGTQQLTAGHFRYRDLGERTLKGIAQPVRAWQVLGVGTVESRFDALHGRRLTPLVGRDEEVASLLRRWAQAKQGEGQVVLISGEPGIGKSRLSETVRERIAKESHFLLRYQCSPHHTNSAFYPVIGQLEDAAGFIPQDSTGEKLQKLKAVLEQACENPTEHISLIAMLLSIPTEGCYEPLTLHPLEQKRRTFEALVEQLEGLSHFQPVLCIFEDMHWVDPSTFELLDRLVGRVEDLRVLILVTFRPEFAAPWVGQAHTTSLVLSRINRHDSRAMVQRLAGTVELSEALIDEVVSKVDGVPLFIEEMTKTVLESKVLAGRHHGANGNLVDPVIPTSLHDSLMSRLDRLGSAKHVAQVGAAIGRKFSSDLLSSVCDLNKENLDSALRRLIEAELVFVRGTPPHLDYTFKHALVQDTAYASLLRDKRRLLHARIARVLEEQYPETGTTQPELIAHHYAEAGVSDLAVRYWLTAGQLALERSAMEEAGAHSISGLRELEKLSIGEDRDRLEIDIQAVVGAAFRATKGSGHSEVESAYRQAYQLMRRLGDTKRAFPVLYGVFHSKWARGNLQNAKETADELLNLAQLHGKSDELLVAHTAMSTVAWHLGENSLAKEHSETAFSIYDPERHDPLESVYGHQFGVLALRYLGLSQFSCGYPDKALKAATASVALARKKGVHCLCHALVGNCNILINRREPESSLKWAQECIELSDERSFGHFASAARTQYGWALVKRGDLAAGIETIHKGLDGWAASGIATWWPLFRLPLIEAYIENGQLDDAMTIVDEELARVAKTDERQAESLLLMWKGDALLAANGNTSDVEAHYKRAIDVARNQSARSWELRAAIRLARLWRDAGKRKDAYRLISTIYDWFKEGFDTADLIEAKALLRELA